MQVGLHSEMRVTQINGSTRTWISFIWTFPHKVFVSVTVIALPISLCCQSFIDIPKTYIQYNPANSHPLGEYEFKVNFNKLSGPIYMQISISTKGNGNLGRVIRGWV